MSSPQQNPSDYTELEQGLDEIIGQLRAPRVNGSAGLDASAASIPPPASSAGTPRQLKWDPPNMRVTSPRQLLAIVADNAGRLQEEIGNLMVEITGEAPPERGIRPAMRGDSLLHVISHLAHEIDAAHSDVARVVAYLRERVA